MTSIAVSHTRLLRLLQDSTSVTACHIIICHDSVTVSRYIWIHLIHDHLHTDPSNSELLGDVSVEIDCSNPNQITVRYPDITDKLDSSDLSINTPVELLLSCYSSNDSFQVGIIIHDRKLSMYIRAFSLV